MTYHEKLEIIFLLTTFKESLPPQEQRKVLTHYYDQIERRIDTAISRLRDKDFNYIVSVNDHLLYLQLKGKISPDEYFDYAKPTPE